MNRSQRIAIWVLTLIGLLAAWKLFGQGFGNFRSDQPFLARNYATTSVTNPQTIAGIYCWWLYTDLATNDFKVNTWTDRVAGIIATNLYAAPTNYTLGMYYPIDAGMRVGVMTNSPGGIPAADNMTTCFIIRPIGDTDFTTLFQDGTSAFRVRRFSSGLAGNWRGGDLTEATAFKNPALDKYIDIVIIRTNGSSITIYTNGVVTAYNNVALTTSIVPTDFLCTGASANRGLEAYVTDIVVYTNNFSTANLADFHFYATNTYNYAP